MGDVGAAALSQVLGRDSILVTLSLKENKIGDSGAVKFAKVGCGFNFFKINLCRNPIGQDGISQLQKITSNYRNALILFDSKN